jgi:hypothetical protein
VSALGVMRIRSWLPNTCAVLACVSPPCIVRLITRNAMSRASLTGSSPASTSSPPASALVWSPTTWPWYTTSEQDGGGRTAAAAATPPPPPPPPQQQQQQQQQPQPQPQQHHHHHQQQHRHRASRERRDNAANNTNTTTSTTHTHTHTHKHTHTRTHTRTPTHAPKDREAFHEKGVVANHNERKHPESVTKRNVSSAARTHAPLRLCLSSTRSRSRSVSDASSLPITTGVPLIRSEFSRRKSFQAWLHAATNCSESCLARRCQPPCNQTTAPTTTTTT